MATHALAQLDLSAHLHNADNKKTTRTTIRDQLGNAVKHFFAAKHSAVSRLRVTAHKNASQRCQLGFRSESRQGFQTFASCFDRLLSQRLLFSALRSSKRGADLIVRIRLRFAIRGREAICGTKMEFEMSRIVGIAIVLTVAAQSVVLAQNAYDPVFALQYKPSHRDVAYDKPAVADVKKCKVLLENVAGKSGFAVYSPTGQILRRYMDVNGDRYIDQWRYFNNGIEVFRDIDSDFNNKIDQSRWLNTGGTRWAIDRNEDGRVDSWRTLSAEEASRVAIFALTSNDPALMSTVLVNEADLSKLGIANEYKTILLKQVKDPKTALQKVLAKSKSIDHTTRWTRFDGAMPGIIPVDEGKASEDIAVYEGTMAIVETKGKHGFVQIGELLKVGNVWKLTQIPQPAAGGTIQVAVGGVLMRPASQSGATELTPEMTAIIGQLQQLDKNPPPADAKRDVVIRYLRERRNKIVQIINFVKTSEERDTWNRQLINALASSAQAGDSNAVTELQTLEQRFRRSATNTGLLAYTVYRRYLGDYGFALIAAKEPADQQKIQTQWMVNLKKFVKDFPKSEDTPDAIMQLAVNDEFDGKTDTAKKWYTQLTTQFGASSSGQRAKGALHRLSLVGQTLKLSGPTGGNRSVDIANYRGKIVAVIFTAKWSDQYVQDVPIIRALHQQYQEKGFEVLGVSLDSAPADIVAVSTKFRTTWSTIYQPGVFESPLAREFGILNVPTVFLIGTDGKVISNGMSIDELKAKLAKTF